MDMLMNGAFVPSSTGAVIEVSDPYTGELLDTVPAAAAEDVDLAVCSAREAFSGW